MIQELMTVGTRCISIVPRFSIVQPDEAGVYARKGEVQGEYRGGTLKWFWPIRDTFEKIIITPQLIDTGEQSITCADGQPIFISASIKYSVADAAKALYNVQDYDEAIVDLVTGSLAMRIAATEYEDIELDVLMDNVANECGKMAEEEWGLRILNLWVQNYAPHRVYRLIQ